MELIITGGLRDIANSAWVSTISEMRAKSRSDEEVERVVGFLVKHHHTSPFESVTLTFSSDEEGGDFSSINDYGANCYSRTTINDDGWHVTIDLLNFVKFTMQRGLYDGECWRAFRSELPKMAKVVEDFRPLEKNSPDDVSDIIGEHNMDVELISYHSVKGLRDSHSRATWRVRCPLSIAVQILRHRTGSYNMVSGRYKTIRQELLKTPYDCANYAAKFGEDLNRYLGTADACIARYLQFMRKSKQAKDDGVISNEEYKRLREVARFILPEGRMTELYITYYMDDFYNNYVKLRDSEHAQTEHIWIAQEMQRTVEQYKRDSGLDVLD